MMVYGINLSMLIKFIVQISLRWQIKPLLLVRYLTFPGVSSFKSIPSILVLGNERHVLENIKSSKDRVRLTVKQCALNLFLGGHHERTILKNCLI